MKSTGCKVACMSDTHNRSGWTASTPEADIVVHAGDGTMDGRLENVARWCYDYGRLPYEHKVLIAGNHDWLFQRDPTTARSLCKENGIIYLQDSMAEVAGVKIWGSPWQPWFYDWAFNLPRGAELKAKWDLIPDDMDVVITHGPPHGFGDICYRKPEMEYDHMNDNWINKPDLIEHAGCRDLLDALMRVKPKLHVGGHIHRGYGRVDHEGIAIVNASLVNERYEVVNRPMVVEV